ncbi:RagB/SusD family nutrient uptake outer membrane protein [Sphingobacterium sp. N143]|uniref:RagB/SusD family nutrient uptake outer membrane protein n=1 Tax=Sphingobacterium sp. N143 TaxID=2746727 RepID=UPI00257552B1|nr:RagB/SusD family nutrient uptake outer membrane protein [Sphingobacterium sp. N143]MDM1294562.1 RagB/SusD family nutrient uptake outer membrane protein [Sphingobacterium sp. N143]
MKFKIAYIVLALSLANTSCKDMLETDPTTSVPEEEIYKNTDNVATVINGTWGYLNDTYFTYANPGYTAIMRTSDAMGNDVAVTTKYGYRDAYAFTELTNNRSNRVNSFWIMLYKVIDNANNVITKVDGAAGSDEDKNVLKGRAKVLRAFAYLNLASFYQFSYLKDKNAKVAPIYTEPSTLQTEGKPKATQAEVYELILKDLKDSEVLLVNASRMEKYEINIHVVYGLLARTYLQVGEWRLAAEYAEKAGNEYELMSASDYQNGFNDLGNSEWIWGHKQTNEQNVASYTFHYLDVSSAGSYYYSFMADPYFKNLFDSSDVRYSLFEWDNLPGREGFLRYKKFKFKQNLIGDIVYMRASEMILIEAEGYARAGDREKAITALNKLRTARKAKLFVGADTNKLIDEILIERRKELWGEGFALSDIIRTQGKVARKSFVDDNGKPIQVQITGADGKTKVVDGQGHRVVKFPDGSVFTANSPYYLFSIPYEETVRNPNL